MINGMILSEGSVIEGVKVVEIHPTRVRLSHDGRPFEISINILDR
jgi:predicted nuclease with RNAse H fold